MVPCLLVFPVEVILSVRPCLLRLCLYPYLTNKANSHHSRTYILRPLSRHTACLASHDSTDQGVPWCCSKPATATDFWPPLTWFTPPTRPGFLLNILHLHPPAAPGSPEKLRPGPLNVVLPGLSEPSPRRKRQHRCKHVTPQPDLGTSEQTAVVSERDTCSVFAFSEPTLSVKNCSHSASSKPGVKITRTVNLKTENVKDFC